MSELMPAAPLLAGFLLASVVLAITPGPGVMYIVARSLAEGRAAGLASVAGVALGNLGNAIGASLGLAALFAVSSLAFTLVKYAGAAYLIYLGVRTLRPSTQAFSVIEPAPRTRVFRDGLVVALLNPKTAMFFAAFLPQFLRAGPSPLAQSVALGVTFVALAAATDTLYALAASTIAPRLMRSTAMRAGGRYVTGGTFIGLGLLSAFSGSRTIK